MKKVVRFYQMSTGYVSGSIPPKFEDSHKKPIEACGSDSVMYPDGRWADRTIHLNAREYALKHGYIGYSIDFWKSDYSEIKGNYNSIK